MKRPGAVVAAGVLAAGLWAAPAPASAAPQIADLKISIDGATVAVDDANAVARLTIVNTGPGVARDPVATVDFGGLDPTRIEFDTAMCTEPNPTMCTFGVPDVPAGGKLTYHLTLINVGGTVGPGGSLAAFVSHAGTEPTPGDNVTSVEVAVVEPGVDLSVEVPDVYRWTADRLGEGTTPVAPGGASFAYAVIYNEGTRTAKGVTVEVRVPEHVTVGPDPDPAATCRISADQRSATCDYPDAELVPGTNAFLMDAVWPITVAAEAPAGALTGGTVTATAPGDLDASDNIQRFSVFVAGPPPSPSPPPRGGGGGGLPVTGPMAGGLAAAGAGLLLLGSALVLLTRRRRLVVKP